MSKIKNLIVPYIIFGALTYWLFLTIDPLYLPTKHHLFFGGMKLQGVYGVYWFIPVYLFTMLVFNIISQVKNRKVQIVIVCTMYLVGHYLVMASVLKKPVIWNGDVVLVSTAYFAAGYYFKKNIELLARIEALLLSGALLFGVFVLQFIHVIDLKMDLKYQQYSNPILDIVVPLIFIAFVLGLIVRFERYLDYMKYFGRASLYIMYLHKPINAASHALIQYPMNPVYFVLFGMTIPTAIYFVVHSIDIRRHFSKYVVKEKAI